MRNIRLTLAYDGGGYVGWQVQPNGRSVQAVLEEAIRKLTGESGRILAAGRTDSGVHALGQVANFLTERSIPCENIQRGLQTYLPNDVVVLKAEDAPLEFHATYSAKRKRYRYVIFQSPVRSPFLERYVWWRTEELGTRACSRQRIIYWARMTFAASNRTSPIRPLACEPCWKQDFSIQGVGRCGTRGHWPNRINQANTKGRFCALRSLRTGFCITWCGRLWAHW